ncbi:MAG: putative peroxiredoxin [Rhodobacteraceae bacterium HLUCCA08]|nr:MAG: putative peroxiredoxin [Rhodobacteraceae bacterium HLUCCA08]
MKKMLAALALTALATPALAQDGPDIVTVVTADNPQTQLMAMVLSAQAMEQGNSLHILLCGDGGDMGLAEAPADITAPQPPRDMSPQGLMQMLMQNGATVEVCAIYLPGMGADESVLLEGVGVAQPAAMAAAMAAEGTQVWGF